MFVYTCMCLACALHVWYIVYYPYMEVEGNAHTTATCTVGVSDQPVRLHAQYGK